MDNVITTTTTTTTTTAAAGERELDQLRERRTALRVKHTQALTALMDERADLKGVHALADYFDEAVRWSA